MSEVTPRSDLAVEFLARWQPGGPWVLTAIRPDRRAINTATFTDGGQALAWIQQYNGDRNIYFHVNPTTHELNKKAERQDIAALAWLHVDIDPRAGEDLEEERQRALRLLQSPPGNVPPPTVIIFSGGGYQGFWKLAEPFPINGDLETAERAKLWNLQLELDFGADQCHNVDRIMRLPGTINVPDARKAAKGRVPTLATVVEFVDDRVYPLSRFVAAPPIMDTMPSGGQTFTSPAVTLPSGNVQRLADVNELDQYGVPDRVKAIIVQGHNRDLEGPKQPDDSRSEWLFDAVCQLLRANVPDEVIYAVITDPDFGISESVLDKGSRTDAYARRQIARARDHAVHPELGPMNERYAVIQNVGGRCLVAYEEAGPLGYPELLLQDFTNFKAALGNRRMTDPNHTNAQGQPRMLKLADWWLEHPQRRQYSRLVFDPSGKAPPIHYNLWRGFACDPVPGDCGLFLEHLRLVVCGGNDEHYRYLLGWMAMLFQQPARPGGVAVVLRGPRGAGKGFIAKALGRIVGRHYLHISQASHLVGNFNAQLRSALLVFADEAFYAGDKRHESSLKTLITEPTLAIEAKGRDVEQSPNYTHLIMASNETWVVPAGPMERRFLVLDVLADRVQDTAYFDAMANQLDHGGYQALLHHLLAYDLKGFNVFAVPQTHALREQQERSMGFEESWWYEKLRSGIMLPSSSHETAWPDRISKRELQEDYFTQADLYRINRRSTPTQLSTFLRKINAGERDIIIRDGYRMPSLATMRERWDRVMNNGRSSEWPEPSNLPGRGRLPADDEPF